MTPEDIERIKQRIEEVRNKERRAMRAERAENREPYAIIDPAALVHAGELFDLRMVPGMLASLHGRMALHKLAAGAAMVDGKTLTCPGCIEEIEDLLSDPVPGAEWN